jgi:hypothetical protein
MDFIFKSPIIINMVYYQKYLVDLEFLTYKIRKILFKLILFNFKVAANEVLFPVMINLYL